MAIANDNPMFPNWNAKPPLRGSVEERESRLNIGVTNTANRTNVVETPKPKREDLHIVFGRDFIAFYRKDYLLSEMIRAEAEQQIEVLRRFGVPFSKQDAPWITAVHDFPPRYIESEFVPPYDSTEDTKGHIERVQKRMEELLSDLGARKKNHDASKLTEPEKSAIDRVRPRLKQLPFGSPEYKKLKDEWAAKYHYPRNDHHIEHFDDGILGMNLLQLTEMLADWKAATETNGPDDNIHKSLEILSKQHNFPPALTRILKNTIEYMKW